MADDETTPPDHSTRDQSSVSPDYFPTSPRPVVKAAASIVFGALILSWLAYCCSPIPDQSNGPSNSSSSKTNDKALFGD